MDATLGAQLRTLRERRGWSQEDLAREARVSSRQIQRIESGISRPQPGNLRALAGALGVDVSMLLSGFTADTLVAAAEAFLCSYCGAELVERTFVEHQYGDAESETFACGATRGWNNRPCPKDPRFPKFEDYDLSFFSEDGEATWYCTATGRTESAREVSLQGGPGSSRVEAEKWVKRSYIAARDGYDAAEAQFPLFSLLASE